MARVVGHLMYSPETARAHLQDALDIVAALDVPDDLRVAAFTGALGLVSNKVPVVEQEQLQVIDPARLRNRE